MLCQIAFHDEESLFTTEPKAAILKCLWNNANR